MKVNRRIAGVIRRWLTTSPVLALEAFVAGPRLDQRAVDREVLGREQAAAARLRQHISKKPLGNFGTPQPFSVLGEDRGVPHRIVSIRSLRTVYSTCSSSARS